MGGHDKCHLQWQGRPLLQWVAERAVSQVDTLVINSNRDLDLNEYQASAQAIVTDEVRDLGPVGGILSVMHWVQRERLPASWLACFAGDTPLFPDDYVQRCLEVAKRTGASVVFARSAGRAHYTMALWRLDLCRTLEQSVAHGQRALKQVMSTANATACEFATGEWDPFFNVNTPDDWRQIQTHLAQIYPQE